MTYQLADYIEEKWSEYAGQSHYECMKCRDEMVKTTSLANIMAHVAVCGVVAWAV